MPQSMVFFTVAQLTKISTEIGQEEQLRAGGLYVTHLDLRLRASTHSLSKLTDLVLSFVIHTRD